MDKPFNLRETKFMKWFYKLEEGVAILTVTTIILLTLYNVILRFVFRRGNMWIDEFIVFLMVLMSMLGMAMGVRDKTHSALESLVCKLPRKVQKVIYIFDSIVVAIFLAVACYGGYLFLDLVKIQKMVILKWPVSIMYSFIVIGCVIALIEHIINTVHDIRTDECRFIPLEEQMEMEQDFSQAV
ncbi:MAG: TRAP transporter small permease [Oscillospiraceae bacterium]|nr:TRAP transporter small permease [Oscillospiraceae bacterium]